MGGEEGNEKRREEGKKPKNSLDFQTTLPPKEGEEVQLSATKTKADQFARRGLDKDPREVCETSVKHCSDNLKAENRPRRGELISEMLDARKICSRAHLELGIGWATDSSEMHVPAQG